VNYTEGNADEEFVLSDGEIEGEKPFVCHFENCDFSHRSEWGIEKHFMVSRLFSLCIPNLVYFSISGTLQILLRNTNLKLLLESKRNLAFFVVPTSMV
jgi:hypothetical protein